MGRRALGVLLRKEMAKLILRRPPTALLLPAPLIAISAVPGSACCGGSLAPPPSAGDLLGASAAGFALPKGDFPLGLGHV